MPVKFGNLEIGERFNYAGRYYVKTAEDEALNLHNELSYKFLLIEEVLSFGDMQ